MLEHSTTDKTDNQYDICHIFYDSSQELSNRSSFRKVVCVHIEFFISGSLSSNYLALQCLCEHVHPMSLN